MSVNTGPDQFTFGRDPSGLSERRGVPRGAWAVALLSAIVVLSGCDGSGSRELLRGPTDGFSISVKAGKGGTMSFGTLVPCAQEAGIQITRPHRTRTTPLA